LTTGKGYGILIEIRQENDMIFNKLSMLKFSMMMGCGGCSNNTTVDSPHTCKTCGRMLCGMCGEYCKEHLSKKDE
jgi:hypothetical protein